MVVGLGWGADGWLGWWMGGRVAYRCVAGVVADAKVLGWVDDHLDDGWWRVVDGIGGW